MHTSGGAWNTACGVSPGVATEQAKWYKHHRVCSPCAVQVQAVLLHPTLGSLPKTPGKQATA